MKFVQTSLSVKLLDIKMILSVVTEAISSHLLICINLQADPMEKIPWQNGSLIKEMEGTIWEPGLLTDSHLVKGESYIDLVKNEQILLETAITQLKAIKSLSQVL